METALGVGGDLLQIYRRFCWRFIARKGNTNIHSPNNSLFVCLNVIIDV